MTASPYAQNFDASWLALSSIFILFAIALSRWLDLNLEKDFFIASLRTSLQLVAVGYVLRWVLHNDSGWVNFIVLLVMSLVAAQAITSRLKKFSWELYRIALASLVGSTWPLGILAMVVFFSSATLHQTAFFVPFMGVLLGNTLSSISLTFLGTQKITREGMLEIETLAALGASSLEACRRLYRETLRQALTPILNGMTVVGIVSLPGVMAGQVIGGVDPLLAARFQVLVMFLILFTALVGSLLAIILSHLFFMPAWLVKPFSTFSLASGRAEKWIVMGPSGAGKSRLLKSLAGLDHGVIYQEAQKKSALDFIPALPFYVHQKAFFIPGTVRENLEYPWHFRKYRDFSADQTLISSFLLKFNLSEEILEQEALTLSGGEAQLIHLLRTLLLSPEILFLDEPSAALDATRAAHLEDYLNVWVQENSRSLILITHQPDQARRFASRILNFENGRLSHA